MRSTLFSLLHLSVAALLNSAVLGGQTAGNLPTSAAVGSSVDVHADVVPRFFHKATLLDDGRVLVAGGLGLTIQPPGLVSLDDVSIFDPRAATFQRPVSTANGAASRLLKGRSSLTLTTLRDGRVLAAGGNVDAEGTFTGRATETVEIFSPATGRFDAGPAMNEKRAFHSATRLSDGRVVIAGGKTWQIFDPAADAWSAPIRLIRSRSRHSAVRIPAEIPSLPDRILLVAGIGGGRWLELLDPATNSSRQIVTMLPDYLNDLAAARMADGRVLIVGGQMNYDLQTKSYVYVFDPSDESLRRLADLPLREHGISDHEMISIGDRVIVFGGEQQVAREDTELDYVAIFDGRAERWDFVGTMNQPRDDFAAVRLNDDRVVLIGGAISRLGLEAPTATTEIFQMRDIIVGDVNGDGILSHSDISGFIRIVLAPDLAGAVAFRTADINGDSRVDVEDVAAFEARLSEADSNE